MQGYEFNRKGNAKKWRQNDGSEILSPFGLEVERSVLEDREGVSTSSPGPLSPQADLLG